MDKRDFTTVPVSTGSYVQRILLIVGVLFLVVALSGCARSNVPISFESLCGLSHDQFDALDETSIEQWIQATYSVSATRMLKDLYSDPIVMYVWEKDDKQWIAELREGQLIAIWRYDDKASFSFGQIVENLGNPDSVFRDVPFHPELLEYRVGLDYPKIGVSVGATTLSERWIEFVEGDKNIILDERIKIDQVFCYAPRPSMEEVISEVFAEPPIVVRDLVRQRVPWPGFGSSVPLYGNP